MCSCTYANCYGCTCGCRHTHDTLRAYREGVQAARDAVVAVSVGGQHFWAVGFRDGAEQALAAIDALREEQK